MAATYSFQCPVCSKIFQSDEPGEPCCTGPSETRDDHDMTVMRLLSINQVEVNPIYGDIRAERSLIMPDMVKKIERELILIKES